MVLLLKTWRRFVSEYKKLIFIKKTYSNNFVLLLVIVVFESDSQSVVSTNRCSTLLLDVCMLIKIIFLNIYGFSNLEDLRSIFEKSDILCIYKTWLDSSRVTFKALSRNLLVFDSRAVTFAVKGRAMGGIVIAFNKNYFSAQLLTAAPEMFS